MGTLTDAERERLREVAVQERIMGRGIGPPQTGRPVRAEVRLN